MNKSKLVAFFLAFIPGIGHFYLNRKRAVLYTMGFFLPLFGGGALAFLFGSDTVLILGLGVAAFVWIINMLDMMITLSINSSFSTYQGASSSYVSRHTYSSTDEGFSTEDGMTFASGEGVTDDSVLTQGISKNVVKVDRFNVLFLSIIPGLGHLYVGLMSRGLSFLTGFFGFATLIMFVTFLTHQSGMIIFLGALPVIWLYSLFDIFQVLNRIERGQELVDKTIFADLDEHRADGKKSKMIATLLAIIPGLGQMYLGLQRRGLQLLAAFLLSIYIMDVLNLSLFLFLIPIIWFYSFFDALQQVERYNRTGEVEDIPVVDWFLNHQKWVGIGLLLLGGYYLFTQLFLPVLDRLLDPFKISFWFKTYFQTTLVSILLIGGGIRLVFGKRLKSEANREVANK